MKTKMDNNMTAIVSIIMIGLGFVNGMVVATLIDKYELEKLYRRAQKVLDDKFELEQQVRELSDELESERMKNEEILKKLGAITRQYQYIPPPQGPLTRSEAVSEADSEDEEFPNPASPDVVPKSTD